eukprot:369007_1
MSKPTKFTLPLTDGQFDFYKEIQIPDLPGQALGLRIRKNRNGALSVAYDFTTVETYSELPGEAVFKHKSSRSRSSRPAASQKQETAEKPPAPIQSVMIDQSMPVGLGDLPIKENAPDISTGTKAKKNESAHKFLSGNAIRSRMYSKLASGSFNE